MCLSHCVSHEPPVLPDDLAAAHAVILAQWNARREAEAMVSAASLEIQRLRLLLARARREAFGISYITVPEYFMEAFAPVVERLVGT